jgi:hypothetical protein
MARKISNSSCKTSLSNAKTPEYFGVEDEILLAAYAQIAIELILIQQTNYTITFFPRKSRY